MHWLGTVGCFYMVASLVGASTGQAPLQTPGAPPGFQFPGETTEVVEGEAGRPEGRAGAAWPASIAGGTDRRDLPLVEEAGKSVTSMVAGEGFLAFAVSDGEGGNRVVLIHGERQWLAVYAIGRDGSSRLLSSRPLGQDFQVEFNSTEPTPAEIRRLSQAP
jgi:hypothetical protein